MEGYNNVFENSIYNFNKYINENNSLDLLFSDFYLHDDKFRFIHNGDKVPDLEAIKISNKINSKLYEKYIEINNNKKMIGHSSVTIPVDNIYNELDSRHIMMSIILFDYLSKNNSAPQSKIKTIVLRPLSEQFQPFFLLPLYLYLTCI